MANAEQQPEQQATDETASAHNETSLADVSIPAQELESLQCSTIEFGRKGVSKPCALDLDDGLVVAMSLATPQPWPETPSECWPATPTDSVSGVEVTASVYLEPWELAPTMFPTTFMALTMEEASWLWQPFVPPVPVSPDVGVWSSSDVPLLDSVTPPKCDSVEIGLVTESSAAPRLADTIQEPELGTEECPTVGSIYHRFGTCKPCSFLHKRGCSNGVNCQFCHLCDAGEKKRRQKAKKMQLQDMMREMETTAPIDAASDDVSASC